MFMVYVMTRFGALAAMLGLISPVLAGGSSLGVRPMIALSNKQGDIISYEKTQNELVIRICEKGTLVGDLGAPAGCRLKAGTYEARLNTPDLPRMIRSRLGKINLKTDGISDQEMRMLRIFLKPETADQENADLIALLNACLAKMPASSPSGDEDDSDLQRRLEAMNACQKNYVDAVKVRGGLQARIDAIFSKMETKKVRGLLTEAHDGRSLVFHLLKELATVDPCTQGIGAMAAPWTMCSVKTPEGEFVWRLEPNGVVRDLTSRIALSGKKTGPMNHFVAREECAGKTHLPSGWGPQSELAILEAHGLRQVLNYSSETLWASDVSKAPMPEDDKAMSYYLHSGSLDWTTVYNIYNYVRCIVP